MKNWKRQYNSDGIHAQWQYEDSSGKVCFVACDSNGWIDVYVMLPEKNLDVLVTCGHPKYDTVLLEYYVGKRAKNPHFDDAEKFDCWNTFDGFDDYSVVGWQPMPLPMQPKQLPEAA